jgi:hypothetical protein
MDPTGTEGDQGQHEHDSGTVQMDWDSYADLLDVYSSEESYVLVKAPPFTEPTWGKVANK